MFSALSVAGLKSGAVGKPNFDFGHFRASLFGQKYDLLKSVRILAYTSLRFKYCFVPESRFLIVRHTCSNFDFQNKNRFHNVFRLVILLTRRFFVFSTFVEQCVGFGFKRDPASSKLGHKSVQSPQNVSQHLSNVGSKLARSSSKVSPNSAQIGPRSICGRPEVALQPTSPPSWLDVGQHGIAVELSPAAGRRQHKVNFSNLY